MVNYLRDLTETGFLKGPIKVHARQLTMYEQTVDWYLREPCQKSIFPEVWVSKISTGLSSKSLPLL